MYPKTEPKTVLLVASGDLRQSANEKCWPEQARMEAKLTDVVAMLGGKLIRAHPYKPEVRHGFIASQREGMEVFAGINPEVPLIVAEAVWQYSHHVLSGLLSHRGPILTVANWSGTWPGLVGMLNLNGSLTKAGVKYSTLWSETFDDDFFRNGLALWLRTGAVAAHRRCDACDGSRETPRPVRRARPRQVRRGGDRRGSAPEKNHHGCFR
jgi:hypothetical protein